jgi:hypothetical protein
MATYVNIRRLISNSLTIDGIAISNSTAGTQVDLDSVTAKSDMIKNIGAYEVVGTSLLNDRAAIRRQKLIQGMGLITETCQRGMIATSSAETSGRIIGNPVYLFAGETVTGVVAAASGAGSGQTLVRLGLYDVAGNKLANTADVKTAFQTAGDIASPLTAPYPITTDGVYIPTFVGVGGTQPSLGRMAGGSSNGGGAVGAGTVKTGYQLTGQTDLPTTAALVTMNVLYWFGLY